MLIEQFKNLNNFEVYKSHEGTLLRLFVLMINGI